MADAIPIARTLSIRDCGHDEFWLQERIAANPTCLQLGELEVISRERQQSSGGRLDMLLKNPEGDCMYEVEIMLGETDETHIIRTIEYWDNEKRKWPQRQHFAVLVAESITRRFFNVIQVLSHAIPIIGVQANIVEANGQKILTFSKIIDTYEEREEPEGADEDHDEEYWREKSDWTTDTAKAFLEIVRPVLGDATLNYRKNHIGILVGGNNYFWFGKRSGNKSLLGFWIGEKRLPDVTKLLDEKSMPYTPWREQVRLRTDKQAIEGNAELMREIRKWLWKVGKHRFRPAEGRERRSNRGRY